MRILLFLFSQTFALNTAFLHPIVAASVIEWLTRVAPNNRAWV